MNQSSISMFAVACLHTLHGMEQSLLAEPDLSFPARQKTALTDAPSRRDLSPAHSGPFVLIAK